MFMQVKSLFPVSLRAISAEHRKISNMANSKFMKRSFKDDHGEYIKKLMVSLGHSKLNSMISTFKSIMCLDYSNFIPPTTNMLDH